MNGYEALQQAAAWRELAGRGAIRVTGEDRVRLLHAMTTQQIQELRPGQSTYAFFLNAQGRILADVHVVCFEDHLLLDTEPETAQRVWDHLDAYIIADDVTLEQAGWVSFALEGPRAAEVLGGCGAPVPARPGEHAVWGPRTVWRVSATGAEGYRVLTRPGDVEALRELFANLPQATEDEWRTVRIENQKPRYGEEITDRYLVQETGQLHAIHFSKGCYLGQEIVERVRSRGQVHRHLMGVELDTSTVVAPGVKFTHAGKDAGELASSAYSPRLGKVVGLAYLRTDAAKPGAPFELGEIAGRVR
jgi:aminomethyltransferase